MKPSYINWHLLVTGTFIHVVRRMTACDLFTIQHTLLQIKDNICAAASVSLLSVLLLRRGSAPAGCQLVGGRWQRRSGGVFQHSGAILSLSYAIAIFNYLAWPTKTRLSC